MHGALRIEDVELAPVRLRRDRDRGHGDDGRCCVDGRVDRERARTADDDTIARERKRARAGEGQLDLLELGVARHVREWDDDERVARHRDDAVTLDRERLGVDAQRAARRGPTARLHDDLRTIGDRDTGAVVSDDEGARLALRLARLVAHHAIVPEGEDAERHDLLREMRVGPLVRLALGKELEGGTRVVDLIEVHLAGPVEAVSAGREHGERDERCDGHVAPGRQAARAEPRWQNPPSFTWRGYAAAAPDIVALEARVATHETPDQVRGDAHHHERDPDLTGTAEDGRFDDLRNAQIHVLLVPRERVVERQREGEREHHVGHQHARARDGEREREREDWEEVALVRACREKVEREAGEHGTRQKRCRVPPPPEGDRRRDESDHEQDSAPEHEIRVRFPEVEEDRPQVERVERRVGVGLRRAADQLNELGHDARGVEAPERDREHVGGPGGGAERRSEGAPPRFANELECRCRDDHEEPDAELGLHERGKGPEGAGEPPSPRPGRDDGAEER